MGLLFCASIRILTTEEGGRTRPIASGYRPNWWFGETDEAGYRMYYGAVIEPDRGPAIDPGETRSGTIRPWGNVEAFERLREGDAVDFYEGRRKVGTATITEVIRE